MSLFSLGNASMSPLDELEKMAGERDVCVSLLRLLNKMYGWAICCYFRCAVQRTCTLSLARCMF